jgi:hypothetical protein
MNHIRASIYPQDNVSAADMRSDLQTPVDIAQEAKKENGSIGDSPLIMRVYIVGRYGGVALFLIDLLNEVYTHAHIRSHHGPPRDFFHALVATVRVSLKCDSGSRLLSATTGASSGLSDYLILDLIHQRTWKYTKYPRQSIRREHALCALSWLYATSIPECAELLQHSAANAQ